MCPRLHAHALHDAWALLGERADCEVAVEASIEVNGEEQGVGNEEVKLLPCDTEVLRYLKTSGRPDDPNA
jgi:hypothetical protein